MHPFANSPLSRFLKNAVESIGVSIWLRCKGWLVSRFSKLLLDRAVKTCKERERKKRGFGIGNVDKEGVPINVVLME